MISYDFGSPSYIQKILDVIPADMPGMDYATRTLVHGYQVQYFYSLLAVDYFAVGKIVGCQE